MDKKLSMAEIEETKNKCFQIRRIDTRTKVYEIPPQQILSTDSVTLTVDAVIYYRVFDPVRAA